MVIMKVKINVKKSQLKKILQSLIVGTVLGFSIATGLNYHKTVKESQNAFKESPIVDRFAEKTVIDDGIYVDLQKNKIYKAYEIRKKHEDFTPDYLLTRYEDDMKLYGVPDYMATPEEYLKNGRVGDCEDYANFVGYILKKKGYHPKIVIGKCGLGPEKGHAWVETKINGSCYEADVNIPSLLVPKELWQKKVDCYPVFEIDENRTVKFYSGCD